MNKKEEFACLGLTNENYEYHLSGDCREFCKCMITGNPCLGKTIRDPEDRSSQFFSRAKVVMDVELAKKSCPLYGAPKEIFSVIIKERAEKELNEKLKSLS